MLLPLPTMPPESSAYFPVLLGNIEPTYQALWQLRNAEPHATPSELAPENEEQQQAAERHHQ
jgi:hypothetical protein